MKKELIVVMLLMIVGCNEAQQQTVATTDPFGIILQPSPQWTEKFGDSKESVLIFNLCRLDLNNARQHRSFIDPNDPNSIESRLRLCENSLHKEPKESFDIPEIPTYKEMK